MDLKDIVYNNALVNQVRAKVSADRSRFKDDGHNLDLSYITENLIAMGFPASGIEAAWRNHIDEVASMLHKRHTFQHTLIFNLSDRKYDYEKFDNKIVEVGFPDHYSPPLDVLMDIVLRIEKWIRDNPRNVAVVHCVGGKGRTGTVVVCWLLMSGCCATVQEAFEYFAMKRSKIYKGVTQASQKRYVAYFDDILRKRMIPKANKFILKCIEISPVIAFDKKRNGCRPRIEVYSTQKYPERTLWASTVLKTVDATEEAISLELHVPVAGDILIRCMHVAPNGDKVKMFRVAFHTAFVTAGCAVLRNADLDDLPKKKSSITVPPDFTVTAHFAEPGPEDLFSFYEEGGREDLYRSLWDLARRQAPADQPVQQGFTTALGVASAQAGTRRSVVLTPKWDVSGFDTTRKLSKAPSFTSSTIRSPAPPPATLPPQPPVVSAPLVPPGPAPPLAARDQPVARKPISSLSNGPAPLPLAMPQLPLGEAVAATASEAESKSPPGSPKPVSNSMQLLLQMAAAPVRLSNDGAPAEPASRSAKRHAMKGLSALDAAAIRSTMAGIEEASPGKQQVSAGAPAPANVPEDRGGAPPSDDCTGLAVAAVSPCHAPPAQSIVIGSPRLELASAGAAGSPRLPLSGAAPAVDTTPDPPTVTAAAEPAAASGAPEQQPPRTGGLAAPGAREKRRSVRELVHMIEPDETAASPPSPALSQSAPPKRFTPLPPLPAAASARASRAGTFGEHPPSLQPHPSLPLLSSTRASRAGTTAPAEAAGSSQALSRSTIARSTAVPTKTLPPTPVQRKPTQPPPRKPSAAVTASPAAPPAAPPAAGV